MNLSPKSCSNILVFCFLEPCSISIWIVGRRNTIGFQFWILADCNTLYISFVLFGFYSFLLHQQGFGNALEAWGFWWAIRMVIPFTAHRQFSDPTVCFCLQITKNKTCLMISPFLIPQINLSAGVLTVFLGTR